MILKQIESQKIQDKLEHGFDEIKEVADEYLLGDSPMKLKNGSSQDDEETMDD